MVGAHGGFVCNGGCGSIRVTQWLEEKEEKEGRERGGKMSW